MNHEIIPSALEASPLFRGCHIPLELMSIRTCQSGQMIRDQVEGRNCVGLVISGSVDVYSIALDGRDVQLNTLTDGDCFGICNLLIAEEMETVLRCRTKTTLLFIPKTSMITAMEQDAAFALRYASYCNQKLQFLIQRIELLTMQSCRGKVIEYLLSTQDEQGRVVPGCSRDELARHLGVSRAALFRELSSLSQQGLLTINHQTFLLNNPEAIRQILFQSS